MASPVHVSLRARPRTGEKNANTLTVPLPGIRRMDVVLELGNDVEGESNDVWWTLAAWATLVNPLNREAAPLTREVHLAPSQVVLPPLGARRMHVATLLWPLQPAAASLHVLFSTDGDIPQDLAQAWGFGDTSPHNDCGLFVSPFGHARYPDRLVNPLPDDPQLLRQLEIDGRIPPQSLPRPRPPTRAPRER